MTSLKQIRREANRGKRWNDMYRLAIVIPAYKSTFIEKTIASIANQTCKQFTLYIGNDAGPEIIGEIAKKFSSQINIVYHRFDENIGSEDLVTQWDRCISLIQGEEWIWLFSDDDIMGETCVERFFKEVNINECDVYHFDVKEIDQNGKCTGRYSSYPDIVYPAYIYENKMRGEILSFVVENVFSRNIYQKCGGFQKFDLAWGSDTATWMKFCREKGMRTIHGDYIFWRNSGENITSVFSQEIAERKLNALVDFFAWVKTFYNEKLSCRLKVINVYAYIARIRRVVKYVDCKFLRDNLYQFLEIQHLRCLQMPMMLLVKLFIKVEKIAND